MQQQVVDGRRITDAETLKIVTMVYAGYINKNIVHNCKLIIAMPLVYAVPMAISILAHKRKHPVIDYGFVGDVDAVNTAFIEKFT